VTRPVECASVVDVEQLARPLAPGLVQLPVEEPLWHVGHNDVPFATFDTRPDVDSRFSPILTNEGIPLGVLYLAATKQAAIAETLWRSLPLTGARLFLDRALNRPVGQVMPTRALRLAELHDPGLRALGLRPQQLTDTPATCYRWTREFAQALMADQPDLDGFVWMSSRFNTDRVYMLVQRQAPLVTGAGHTLFSDPDERAQLTALCRSANIAVIQSSDRI